MNHGRILELAQELLAGRISVESLAEQIAPATARLDRASLDLDRERRCGYPEVIFGEGKTVAVLEDIFGELLRVGIDVFATRIDPEKAEAVQRSFPQSRYNSVGRTLRIDTETRKKQLRGRVGIVSAGSSDAAVVEESKETLDWMGIEAAVIEDVGVAGPHRFPERLAELEGCDAIVVIAGMEGALPSIVGGHVDCPVIAVPTSIGYGASFNGLAALLGMLSSCAANVTVVNIDAGFKGAYVAGLIAGRNNNQ